MPQPSLPNFTNVPQAADYGYVSGIILPNSGHLRVNVTINGVTVDYIRAARPSQETTKLHNKDISETYFVNTSCYDSTQITPTGLNLSNNYNITTAYPNPTAGNLVIQTEETKDYDRFVALINENGETVVSGKLIKGQAQTTLNTLNIASGIYFVKVFDGINSSTFKIVVTK